MGKGVSMETMMASLPPMRRTAVEAEGKRLIEQEMTLRALRAARGKTQAALAKELGIKQENVSRVEQRADMLISTLNVYLRALGGRLTLTAEFAGHEPVKLTGFGFDELAPGQVTPRRHKAREPV